MGAQEASSLHLYLEGSDNKCILGVFLQRIRTVVIERCSVNSIHRATTGMPGSMMHLQHSSGKVKELIYSHQLLDLP